MSLPLFPLEPEPPTPLDAGAVLLRGWVGAQEARWLAEMDAVLAQSPWRQMDSPGGQMSVAMSNCGSWGWLAEPGGYRYSPLDPQTGQPWPPLSDWMLRQAAHLAEAAGYPGFVPDAGLLNRYQPGARMGLHRDADERDRAAPIVSLSFGLPCRFFWGGLERSDPVRRLGLLHGDVLVWGGASRMRYHGVAPLAAGRHHLLGAERWNLTLRMARSSYLGSRAVAD